MIDSITQKALSMAASAASSAGSTAPSPMALDVQRFQVAMQAGAPQMVVAASPSAAAAAPGGAVAAAGFPVPGGAVSGVGNSMAADPANRSAASTASKPVAGRTVGDAILESFRSVASNASAEWGQAREAIMSPAMTSTQLLQTQMKLLNVSFQIDLIGKGVSKATSNLEQVLKTQ